MITPDRFQQIEELYHAAREASAEQRAALLCQTDPELRREIEELLAQPGEGEFLDRPAIQNAPELLIKDEEDGALTPGMCLGPYRVESKLGEGGMGEVFRAVDTRLGRAVAIKVAHERFSARFEREARAISSLNHPHICTLYDVGPNYLVMELVEGETIASKLKRDGPLTAETALGYSQQIVAALIEAHGKGIVHRDLKPANLMIARSGVKILDFGLAKSGCKDDLLTGERTVMGTPSYMAPEQAEGKPADARADIYSFGCVLYEMLTGARVLAHQRKRIVSRTLEKIVSRCLEQEPDRRWQSAADLGRELALAAEPPPGRWKIPVAAAAAIVAVAGASYLYLHRTPKLTDTDTIVLADFANTTGDPVFDGTLRQGLAIQLEQSPFLRILNDGEARRALKLMSLPPTTPIRNQVAREICIRESAAATIDGMIASFGSRYVITLQAISCEDGDTLVREQAQATDKEHVLTALGAAASAMRAKLGEPRHSIQQLSRPLDKVTTPSLEALKIYTPAMAEMSQGRFLTAIPLFQRATEIDPGFAIALHYLGVGYENAGDIARGWEYSKRAFALIDSVSEFERDQIAPHYYRATGELEKSNELYRLAIRHYPRRWEFNNQLSVNLIDLGQYEEGLKFGLEAVSLQDKVEPPYRRPLDAYICLDRLPEARQLADRLRRLGLDGPRIHQRFLEMAYVEDDEAAVAREIQWFTGKPEEYLSLGLQAARLNEQGQRLASHKLFRRAAEAVLRRGLRNAARDFDEADAQASALWGDCKAVRELGGPALGLAVCGEAAKAESLAAENSKLYPNGTIWNAVELPAIRAALAMHQGQPEKSVELLESATPYELGYLSAVYLRGLALLQLQRGAQAAVEFRKVVDHRGANWGSGWRYPYWGQFYSLSQLGLARAYSIAGNPANARKAYRAFLARWKDADSDSDLLRKAKAEYGKLSPGAR